MQGRMLSPSPRNGRTTKTLVAYFSWGGNTQHVAERIASLTGGTLFRIEPEKTVSRRIQALYRGSESRKGSRRPPGHQIESGELGTIRYRIHRLSRLVVDGPDDYQYVRGELRLPREKPSCRSAPMLATYRDETLGADQGVDPCRRTPERIRNHRKGYKRSGKLVADD